MKKDFYRVVGVMSGTSLDGVDLVLCEFLREAGGHWTFTIQCAETIEYPESWQSLLAGAIKLPREGLSQLDREYTQYLGKIIKEYLQRNGINNIDAVCSHGHTVYHQPAAGVTYQMGNLPFIAKEIGFPVVCDFRVQDVALGGQGAPLVPIGDRLLFSEYDYCLNLGGFANISFESNGNRIAYDICPVNVVLNHLSHKVGKNYDDGGSLAASGALHEKLLRQLNELDYYSLSPPKSLGMEWVNASILPILETAMVDVPIMLRTYTEHIAQQLAREVSEPKKVLVTGGGAYNRFLLERVRQLSKADWIIPEPFLIEFKEALIFGLLGILKLRDEVNCLASVTGASRDHSSGCYFLP